MKHFYFICLGLFSGIGSLLAQVPNNGFESWITVGAYEVPDSWSTLNHKTATNGAFTATKGIPGNPGNSYLKLTAKAIGGGMVPGLAVCGKLDSMTMQPMSGYPFTARPAYFKGKWQYMVYGSSIGSIKVLLTKWNTTASARDTIAYVNKPLPGMVMSWANFNLTLNYQDSLHYPDSCLIVLSASDGAPTANDYLWVDDLSFSGTVAVVTPPVDLTGIDKVSKELNAFTVFPNPAKTNFSVNYNLLSEEKITLGIFDATGKEVKTIKPVLSVQGTNTLNIETTGLARGLYILVLKSRSGTATRKLVIE